jgi:hypothetical protein
MISFWQLHRRRDWGLPILAANQLEKAVAPGLVHTLWQEETPTPAEPVLEICVTTVSMCLMNMLPKDSIIIRILHGYYKEFHLAQSHTSSRKQWTSALSGVT